MPKAPKVLRGLRVDFGSLVDSPANPGARVALFKFDHEEVSMPDPIKKDEATPAPATPAAAPTAEAPKPAEAPAAAAAPDATAEIAKRDAELAKRDAELAALRKRIDDAEAIAKAERDKRETAEWIAKAKTYEHLPVKADEFGPVLKRLANTITEDDLKEVERVLKAADEGLAKFMVEKGTAGKDDTSDPWSQIEALAKAEREKNPALSMEQARVRAMEANPALVKQHREHAH